MGAGKSTVGALLADAWGVTARDTDADVEALEGRSVSDIFVDSGEAHFRDLERKAVAEALATHDGVLSLGGGAVLDPTTRDLLQGQIGRASCRGRVERWENTSECHEVHSARIDAP